jgi:hypothetical protein
MDPAHHSKSGTVFERCKQGLIAKRRDSSYESNQPEPQPHAAPEFNALAAIRKPALRHRFVPESAIRHTQVGIVERGIIGAYLRIIATLIGAVYKIAKTL